MRPFGVLLAERYVAERKNAETATLPHMPRLIIFEDGCAELGPLGDLRCSMEQRTGVFSALERAERVFDQHADFVVPDAWAELVAERTGRSRADETDDSAALIVNGRLATGGSLAVPELGCVHTTPDGTIAVGHLSGADLTAFFKDRSLGAATVTVDERASCFQYPWDILDGLSERIAADIAIDITVTPVPEGVVVLGEHSVQLHSSSTVMPTVVLDTTQGPIWIDEGAVVRPNAVLCGPCAIGRECVITDRALIKPGTSLGPSCKVGGEVGSTVFQGFSNKSHDGHLGDALVGEWVNIGAGTDNSNLLNTYSEVLMRLEHDDSLHRTGRVFMGCVLADHVKLAIGTRVMTGTTIGTGSMIASSEPPPTYTRRFSWVTDKDTRTYQWKKFAEVAETVMARRGIALRPAYRDHLEALYAK